MLLGNHIEEGAGVKAENWFNRTLVFAAGNGVGLVVIHVAGGDDENAAAAERGLIARFASPYDAYAIIGAVTELVSRQVRLGEPHDVLELAPVIDRLILGVLAPVNSAGSRPKPGTQGSLGSPGKLKSLGS